MMIWLLLKGQKYRIVGGSGDLGFKSYAGPVVGMAGNGCPPILR